MQHPIDLRASDATPLQDYMIRQIIAMHKSHRSAGAAAAAALEAATLAEACKKARALA